MNGVKRKIAVLLVAMAMCVAGTGILPSNVAAGEGAGVVGVKGGVKATALDHTVQDSPAEAGIAGDPIYRVLGIVLFVWFGISLYLFRLDRKVSRLEKGSE